MHTRLGETNAASAASNDRLPWEHSQPSFMRWDGRVRCRTNWKSGAAGGASASPHHRWASGARASLVLTGSAWRGVHYACRIDAYLPQVSKHRAPPEGGLTQAQLPSPTVARPAWSAQKSLQRSHRLEPASRLCSASEGAQTADSCCGKPTGNGKFGIDRNLIHTSVLS
jgi:hypothetical protein